MVDGGKIQSLQAWTALNSQGQPTVACRVTLDSGASGMALVPSGTSRGRHEAAELRDAEASAFGAAGVGTALANILGPIREAMVGLPADDQRLVDRTLIDTDGTADKSRLGANALLAVSLASAQAAAGAREVPLWRHVLESGVGQPVPPSLPAPTVSLLSGGLHAAGAHPIQDFLVIPLRAQAFSQALATTARLRQAVGAQLEQTVGGARLAPSGAFLNTLPTARASLELLCRAAAATGLEPRVDVGFALDVAASGLRVGGGYRLDPDGQTLAVSDLIEEYAFWVRELGVVSIEDPLDDDDWADWVELTTRLDGCQVIGDDLFTTSLSRLRRGVAAGAANAILLKPTQCGTLTELLDVADEARLSGFARVLSQRSVETEDAMAADLAIGCRADQVKFGPLLHSERLAKYNRLLELESTAGIGYPGPALSGLAATIG